MTSPTERLLRAAEVLESRASEATEGPWAAHFDDVLHVDAAAWIGAVAGMLRETWRTFRHHEDMTVRAACKDALVLADLVLAVVGEQEQGGL